MFSRLQRFYNSIKVGADMAMLALAFLLAYAIRFFGPLSDFGPMAGTEPPWEDTVAAFFTVLVVYPFSFHQARLYQTNRSRTHLGELFAIARATVTATLIMVAITYFTRERYSRLTFGMFVLLAFVLVALNRIALRQLLNEVRRRGFNLKSILVIGAGELGRRVIETIHAHRELGFQVTGVLSRHDEKVGTELDGVPVLGRIEQVGSVLDGLEVDQVMIALPIEDQPMVKGLMEQLALRTVDVKVVPDLYQYITVCGGLEEFGGLPIISLQGAPLDGWNVVLKRLFDMAVAAMALVLLSPLMLLTAVAVKLASPGPVFYRQERMGLDGRVFRIMKFRTMRQDAERTGAAMTQKDDPRRTALGSWLRKLSIDELPQLFNVLRGDMSLVGPRPERPVFIEEFKQHIPKYHLRHKVKAGITGWAQVNGLRGQTSIEKRIEYDLYYIENWSLLLDLKILTRTAFGGFLSKNAY